MQKSIALNDVRKLSTEEVAFRTKINTLKLEIKSSYQLINTRTKQLQKAAERQQIAGVAPGERPITEQLIIKLTDPLRQYIQRLEADLQTLEDLTWKVRHAAQSQRNLF